MKPTTKPEVARYCIVLVTAPDRRVARKLARLALEARVVACVNVLPRLESHYWWQGRLETSKEVLLVMKTTSGCLDALEDLVVGGHPYDTPEFVVLPIQRGNQRYLDWLADSVVGTVATAPNRSARPRRGQVAGM